MGGAVIPREVAEETWNAVRDHGSVLAAATALGLHRNTVTGRYNAAILRYGMPDARTSVKAVTALRGSSAVAAPDAGAIKMPDLPEDVADYGELKQRSIREFNRYKAAHDARRLVDLPVRMDGPIGLMATGDPHVDARGCDWSLIDAHTKLVRETEGLFATNVGDLANNWVGRLARLYAEQHVTPRETRVLIEGFFNDFGGKLLFIDCGNHDLWNGQDDLYRWLARAAGTQMAWHGNRVRLNFANGCAVTINSRHDFKGSSQWNITHGPLKAAMMGDKDDIYTCGHLHAGGYQLLVHAGGEISHVTRLSSYKVLDPFKDEHGWRDQNLPAAVFVINPDAPTPAAKVAFFADVNHGADYLTFLRRRHGHSSGGRQVRAGRDGSRAPKDVPDRVGERSGRHRASDMAARESSSAVRAAAASGAKAGRSGRR
jgi:hypothetical protein